FACPDSQLSAALGGVVRAIDELPVVTKPQIAAVEGSEAVIEAFRRLGASFVGLLSFKLPPSPEELRALQKKAIQSAENGSATAMQAAKATTGSGLSRRDYIPLAIAIFVDLCLLLVSIRRPASPLERLVPKMRAAERGPVIQILSRFNDIHRDKEVRENFEVFRHVVFDYHGDYYAAVPLNTPYRPNPHKDRQRLGYGVSDAEKLMQEAHLLSNLFASFEKEKIFSRVMNPLLSTSVIQKRLRRQGSKFANAGAFRVYRFRDGAWSEIILGAVMGAARRVEEQKMREMPRVRDMLEAPLADPSPHAHPRRANFDTPAFERHAAAGYGGTRGEPRGPVTREPSNLATRQLDRVLDEATSPVNGRNRDRQMPRRGTFTPHVIEGGEAGVPRKASSTVAASDDTASRDTQEPPEPRFLPGTEPAVGRDNDEVLPVRSIDTQPDQTREAATDTTEPVQPGQTLADGTSGAMTSELHDHGNTPEIVADASWDMGSALPPPLPQTPSQTPAALQASQAGEDVADCPAGPASLEGTSAPDIQTRSPEIGAHARETRLMKNITETEENFMQIARRFSPASRDI
ncbi:MAG: hypothetical protein ACK5JT_06455, partial [Hyphomicrobiaceae bacterium]